MPSDELIPPVAFDEQQTGKELLEAEAKAKRIGFWNLLN